MAEFPGLFLPHISQIVCWRNWQPRHSKKKKNPVKCLFSLTKGLGKVGRFRLELQTTIWQWPPYFSQPLQEKTAAYSTSASKEHGEPRLLPLSTWSERHTPPTHIHIRVVSEKAKWEAWTFIPGSNEDHSMVKVEAHGENGLPHPLPPSGNKALLPIYAKAISKEAG